MVLRLIASAISSTVTTAISVVTVVYPNSPFTGFSHIQIPVYLRALCGYHPRVVCICLPGGLRHKHECVPVNRIL